MSKRHFIVAGNYEQYSQWIKERGLSSSDWVYVFDTNNIRGIRNPTGRLVGTWYEREDAMNILTALMVASDVRNENLEKALVMWIESQTENSVGDV